MKIKNSFVAFVVICVLVSAACTPKASSVSQAAQPQAHAEVETTQAPTADLQTERSTFAEYKGNETSVVIPHGYTHIGDAAFFGKELTSVTIPNSVVEIGSQAFQGNQLSSVIIPGSVTFIEGGAFSFNPLVSITIGANVMLEGDICYTVNEHDAYVASDFNEYYNDNGRAAGTYTRPNAYSQDWTRGSGQSAAFDGMIRAQVENGSALNSRVSEVRADIYIDDGEPGDGITVTLSTGSYSNGGFSISLPQSLDKELLRNIMSIPEMNMASVNVSDRAANFYNLGSIMGYDSDGIRVGLFFNEIDDDNRILSWYVDRDLSINGSFDEHQRYDLVLKKGWNTVYSLWDQAAPTMLTTTKPANNDGQWVFR